MPEPSSRDPQSPSKAQSLLTVIVHSSGELEFGLSPRDGEYGKHVVSKIKEPTQEPTPYRCRAGAHLQFRELTGQPIGAPVPLVELKIIAEARRGGSLRYLIPPASLRGAAGLPIAVPVLSTKQPHTPRPGVAPTTRPAQSGSSASVPSVKPGGSAAALSDLKAPPAPREVKAPSESGASPTPPAPASPKPGMVPVDAEVEKALREALLKENSDLHDKIRRSNHTGAVRTWIDGYFDVAQARLKTSPTPMAHMAQVFLNPAYLNLKHADPIKAAETVMLVASFFDVLSKSAPGPLKKFAREALEKYRGETEAKQDQTVLGKRAATPEELLAKLEDAKSSNAILEAVNRQLFSVVSRGVHAARRIQTDAGKRDALKTLNSVLDASQKTKAYKSMSAEERVRFDADVARERGRIDSLRRSTNLGQ